MGPKPRSNEAWIELSAVEMAAAERLGASRLRDRERRFSPTRPSAAKLSSQIRGAAGEIAALSFLRSLGWAVQEGFWDDRVAHCDLHAGPWRIEVITAQVVHRRVTGFCVPPNKLRSAQRRGAQGFLFMGCESGLPCRRLMPQAFALTGTVAVQPIEHTKAGRWTHKNHVVPPGELLDPRRMFGRGDIA